MTLNPDNLIFFYLTGALIFVGFAIIYYAHHKSSGEKRRK